MKVRLCQNVISRKMTTEFVTTGFSASTACLENCLGD